MAERFHRLFILPGSDLYTEGSPILISKGVLLKDTQTGNVIAQIKFQNIGEKKVIALTAQICAFDIMGKKLANIEHQYLDFSAKRDEFFGQKDAVVLPDAEARSFTVNPMTVLFDDHSVWSSETETWTPIPIEETLNYRLGDLAAQYRREAGEKLRVVTQTDRDLWRCSCGALNRIEEEDCHVCRKNRVKMIELMDEEKLRSDLEAYEAKVKAEAEEAAAKEKKRKKKVRLTVLLTIVGLIVLFVGSYLTTYFLADKAADKGDYQKASRLLFWKDVTKLHDESLVYYVKALELKETTAKETSIKWFRSLGEYKDSDRLWKETQFQYASEKLENGDFAGASSLFTELKECGYSGADTQVLETTYQKAWNLRKEHRFEEAIILFKELKDQGYKDSDTQINETKYTEAEYYLKKASYNEAISLFSELEKVNYRDSEERVKEAKYQSAESLLYHTEYDKAISLFSELSRSSYLDAATRVKDAKYQKAESLEKKGEVNKAIRLFTELGKEKYKDSETRAYALRYDEAMKLVKKGQYLDAINTFNALKSAGYAKSNDGLNAAKDGIKSVTRGGSTEYLEYWNTEYKKTKKSADLDYLLFSIHNQCVKYSTANKETLYPNDAWAVKPYYSTVAKYYAALKKSSFSYLCNNQCYDGYRLFGNWTGSGYYFKLQKKDKGYWIHYSLPFYEKADSYFKIYNHTVSLYRNKDNKKLCDLYRISFSSDSKASFYCYKDRKSYTLTKKK